MESKRNPDFGWWDCLLQTDQYPMSYFGIPIRNGIPIGLGSIAALGLNNQWNPKYLFGNGEQGVWYDPSDFSTMFEDEGGSIPVTAVEQPVGLMLDKHTSDGRGIVNRIRNNTMQGAVRMTMQKYFAHNQ